MWNSQCAKDMDLGEDLGTRMQGHTGFHHFLGQECAVSYPPSLPGEQRSWVMVMLREHLGVLAEKRSGM
ncbi:hypothetical protein SRHO_G00163310 [Serrasalmus rhombeus]